MALKLLQRMLAKQLGGPSGLMGSLVANKLNQRNRTAIAAAVTALGGVRGKRVADVGFGGGVGLELLLDTVGDGGHVHGVEPSSSMVARATKSFPSDIASGRLLLHEATMARLPFGDGELDGWISLNTIYFIPDLRSSFTELARVLAPTGRGVLGAADPEWLGRQPFAEHGFVVRPIDDVVAELHDAGLAVSVESLERPGTDGSYNLLICSHASPRLPS